MGGIPLSLCRFVDWVRIVELFGIVPQGGLPYVMPCPKCGAAAKIYSNVHSGGQWFGCYGCNFKGDMITLAAVAYGLDQEAALRKLIRDGLITEPLLEQHITGYLTKHYKRAVDYAELWEKARQRTVVDDTTELRGLRQKLGLDMRLEPQRWLDGPGQFVGGSTRYEVEHTFQPSLKEGDNLHNGEHRVFHGKGWKEMLVFPFEDLPGRKKAFLFFGNDHETTFYHRRWNDLKVSTGHMTFAAIDTDAGVSMWFTTAQDHPQFGNKVFVLDDIFTAARLQCDHYLNNLVPLPMLVTYAGAKYATLPSIWQHFRDKQLIFLGDPAQDISVVRHAQAANGMIGQRPTGNGTPMAILTKIAEEAKPWQEALYPVLGQLPPNQAEGLFLRINFPKDVQREFLKRCPSGVRLKLPHIVEEPEERIYFLDGKQIVERSGVWLNAKNGEPISTAVIRLDQMTFFKQSQKTLYTGRVLFKGKEYPFSTFDPLIEANGAKWLRNFLMAAGAGLPIIHAQWHKRLLALAMLIQEPKLLTATEQLGWNAETQSMVFPEFTIAPGGEIRMEKAVLDSQPAPGRVCIPPKTPVGAEELLEFRKHPLCPLGLGIFRSIIQNLLAPAFCRPQLGIALCGDGAERDGVWLAGQLGCVASVSNDFGWPAFTNSPRKKRYSWHKDWKNMMVAVTPIVGDVLACMPGWFVLERAQGAPRPLESGALLNKLVPDYFKWLLDNKMQLGEVVDYHQRMDASIATYLGARSQSKPERWLKYFMPINPDGANAKNAFFRLIGRLASIGDLPLERLQLFRTVMQPVAYLMPDVDKVFIAQTHLHVLTRKYGTPLPHWDFIEEACKGELTRATVHGMQGWLISEEAWVAALKEAGGLKPRLYRIYKSG